MEQSLFRCIMHSCIISMTNKINIVVYPTDFCTFRKRKKMFFHFFLTVKKKFFFPKLNWKKGIVQSDETEAFKICLTYRLSVCLDDFQVPKKCNKNHVKEMKRSILFMMMSQVFTNVHFRQRFTMQPIQNWADCEVKVKSTLNVYYSAQIEGACAPNIQWT